VGISKQRCFAHHFVKTVFFSYTLSTSVVVPSPSYSAFLFLAEQSSIRSKLLQNPDTPSLQASRFRLRTISGLGAGLAINIDLIELGGEAVPILLEEPLGRGDVYVATLVDLWRMRREPLS
jgi:hypothetical protein